MTDEKITRGLLRTLAETEEETSLPIIVQYKARRHILHHRAPRRGIQEGYRYRLRPFVQMYATPDAIRNLKADPDTVRIYEDLPVHAFLDTSVPHIQVPRVWKAGLTGEGVRIAIIDTGIDEAHPDFEQRIIETTDFTGHGPADEHGHGTHCAGIAAGSGAASQALYRGVAPGAHIYSARVLGANGGGMMSDVMAGVDWAVQQGVQIINLSLGSPGLCDGTDALCDMCNAAVREGVVVCVAAGNEGPSDYTIGSPGCAKDVITVGGTNDADQVAEFSSRGPTADGRIKPDIVLPGNNIISARANGTKMGSPVNQYYTTASGTSMSAPHAAGICALLLQAEPNLSPQEVKERLMSTSLDLGDTAYAQGSGRADAWRAYQNEISPAPEPTPTPPPPGPAPGQGCLVALLHALFLGRRRE
ncbi:MAG: S8 family peptidase [Chloroflexota bacterium]|nr:S8 family peptidase [Chloroflexota bacterium]